MNFLMDERVIRRPKFYEIIFNVAVLFCQQDLKKSAKGLRREIWWEEGSPLDCLSERFTGAKWRQQTEMPRGFRHAFMPPLLD